MLQKRLFYDAKPTLLLCKIGTLGTQNNRLYKHLITRLLYHSIACEKYLLYWRYLFIYKVEFPTYLMLFG